MSILVVKLIELPAYNSLVSHPVGPWVEKEGIIKCSLANPILRHHPATNHESIEVSGMSKLSRTVAYEWALITKWLAFVICHHSLIQFWSYKKQEACVMVDSGHKQAENSSSLTSPERPSDCNWWLDQHLCRVCVECDPVSGYYVPVDRFLSSITRK